MYSSLSIWIALVTFTRPSSARTSCIQMAFVGSEARSTLPKIHACQRSASRFSISPNTHIRGSSLRPSQLASATDGKNHSDESKDRLSHARQSLPQGYALREIPGKGTGVITTKPIPQNTAVGDYTGEILTHAEKDRRYLPSQVHTQTEVDKAWIRSRQERGQTVTGSYVYGVTVPDNNPPVYIDSEDEDVGGWTRFLNHSSEWYGCNLIPKSVHESWDGNPRVWFVATRDIEEGEELCFDYGDDYWLDGDVVA